MENNEETNQGRLAQLRKTLSEKLPLDKIRELKKTLSQKLPLDKIGELKMKLREKINIPPQVQEMASGLKDKFIPDEEGEGGSNLIKDYAPRISEFSSKISEKYTPTKGLMIVLCFLTIDMVLQLYMVTKVATFEIVENSIKIDFVTVVSFVSYTLTMISLLFILSEFFLMRRMEALFSMDEIKSIGNGQVDLLLEPESEVDPEDIEDQPPVLEEEKPDRTSLFDIRVEVEEEVHPAFAAMEAAAESPVSKYNVLEVEIPEDDPIEEAVTDPWDFDVTPAQVEAPEPEKAEPQFDMSNSEILATLSELKDVVKQLKARTGRTD